MICPVCRSHIADGLTVCPACRADLLRPIRTHEPEASYCPACATLVPPGQSFCPECGMPIEHNVEVQPQKSAVDPPELVDIDDPDDIGEDPQDTGSMPRIESAIPSGEEMLMRSGEHMPRARVMLVAAAAAMAIMGGIVLLLAHPWDPYAYSTRTKTPADMSEFGSVEPVTSLAAQDTEQDPSDFVRGDEQTLKELSDAYDKLGELAGRVDASEQRYWQLIEEPETSCEEAVADAQATSLEISNLISSMSSIDVTSGTYVEEKSNLNTLGNWLRNRSDTLVAAWERMERSDAREQDKDVLVNVLKNAQNSDGINAYKALFDANYANWAPRDKN